MKLCHHQEKAIYAFSQVLGWSTEKKGQRLKKLHKYETR